MLLFLVSLLSSEARALPDEPRVAHCVARCEAYCASVHTVDWARRACFDNCTGTRPNQPVQVNFTLVQPRGLLGNPVAMRFGRFSDDSRSAPQRLFICSQDGRIHFTGQTTLKDGPLSLLMDLSSQISTTINHFGAYSEAGLLGFALHPRFSQNGRFFVWYSVPRTGGNASNTPNCSFAGGYGSSGPNNDRRNFGADRVYDPDLYTDLLLLEEYQQMSALAGAPLFRRRLLTLKHLFINHYSINNLLFEENGKLLVSVGDGGCFFDQFAVAQNRSFLSGKILSVDVDANSARIPPLLNCSTPVLLWQELRTACPNTSAIFTLYASGVRNMGHMSLDRERGLVQRFTTMVGQNRAEAIYRFDWEANFGWPKRENRLCSCVVGDVFFDPQCDFTQTLEQCRNESAVQGRFTRPLATLNQDNDHVSSNAGGFVYRGTELPCALHGQYLWGDWSTKDKFTPGFPAPFNGTLQLFHLMPPPPTGDDVERMNYNGHLRLGGGLSGPINYLASWAYDEETDRLYLGVQDMIPSYNTSSGLASTRGQIYLLSSPVIPLGTPPMPHYGPMHALRDALSDLHTLLIIVLVLLGILLLALLLAALGYLARDNGKKYKSV